MDLVLIKIILGVTCPLEKKLDANQVVNGILGLGGEKFK